jgi:hypothetical protein
MVMTVTIEEKMKMQRDYIPALIEKMVTEHIILPEEKQIVEEWATKYFDRTGWETLEGEYRTVSYFKLVIFPFVAGLRTGKTGVVTVL